MSLSFLLDEDISYRVAEGLRLRGVDAISVQELGRAQQGLADEEQLRFAAAQGRGLLTYNRSDYQALASLWRLRGQEHPGIVWCAERSIPRRAIGELIRAIEALARDHETLQDLCISLPRLADYWVTPHLTGGSVYPVAVCDPLQTALFATDDGLPITS